MDFSTAKTTIMLNKPQYDNETKYLKSAKQFVFVSNVFRLPGFEPILQWLTIQRISSMLPLWPA